MRIYLIRHGETDLNATRVLQHPHTPLGERGREQARRLGERMRGVPLAHVLSSDYARAHATAEAVSATTGAPITVLPSLRERNLGDLRGRSWADLPADPFAPDYHPPNGESWPMFFERVDRAWREVCAFAGRAAGDFAVVSHALVCHALVERRVPVPEALRPEEIRFGNTSVTVIEGPPFAVSLLACCAHLDPEQVTWPGHSPGV